MRFMQTDIMVLPSSARAVATLHERIAKSGLPFQQARFPFTPHAELELLLRSTGARRRDALGRVSTTGDPRSSAML